MTAGVLVAPPRPDETFTLTDLTDNTQWAASRAGIVDGDGVTWIVTSETGWFDGPPVRITNTDQPRGDGSTLSSQWRSARVVVLTGSAHLPPSIPATTIDAIRRRWTGMCAAGPRVGQLTVTAADGVGQQLPYVVLSDQPKVSAVVGSGWERRFSWQITVTAADPLKYDIADADLTCSLPQPPTSGLVYPLTYPLNYHTPIGAGQVTVINAGTADSWPQLTITAPFDTPTVSNPDTGDAVTFALQDFTPGDFLFVDTHPARRVVLLNGAVTRRAFARVTGEWLPCRAGTDTRLRFRAATYTTSQLTVVAPSASW